MFYFKDILALDTYERTKGEFSYIGTSLGF